MKIWGVILFILLFFPLNVWGQSILIEPYIDRGIYLLEQDQPEKAIEQLQKALEIEPENLEALLYMAVALRLQGETERAETFINRVLTKAPDNPRALIEAGVIKIQKKDYQRAETLLYQALDITDDPELAALAEEYLIKLQRLQTKNYGLSISVGAFYDSNVILEPEGISTGLDKSDEAVTLELSTWYGYGIDSPTRLFGGYNFFQSWYFSETDYNLQDHTISAALQRDLGRVSLVGQYDFKYQLLGGEKYGLYHILSAGITITETERIDTEIRYSHTFRDMYDTDISPDNSDRSGGVDTIRLKQTYRWTNQRLVALAVEYEIENSDMPWWDRKTYGAVVEGMIDLSESLILYGTVSYYDKKSDFNTPFLGIKRHDKVQEYLLSLTWRFLKNMNLMVYGTYRKNDSNSSLLDYSRTIAGFKVRIKML